jgi:2-amino-4-hydroxy-6-hydroxymethyldihydropteridine diphosphokinase
MNAIYLSLGTNINRHHHLTAALNALDDLLGKLSISSIYESKSVGFDGSNFFNAAVGTYTNLTIAELSEALKFIENENGRVRSGPKFSPRTLDIDILTYANFIGVEAGTELPRAEITQNAFVLLPLAEIAPDVIHPQLQKSYIELWNHYDKNSQPLWPIDFEWRGISISKKLISHLPS